MDSSFKKWGVAVHIRWKREWVSYDLKGSKLECPIRNNGDTRIFVWHSHKENGDAHVWHSHRDYGDTQDVCVTFTQRKVGQPHKIRAIYEIKGNNEVYSQWKIIVSQSPKIKWDNSTGKLKNMCGRPTRKKAGWHSPRRKKIWFRESATFVIVTNKYNWNSSTNKTETNKGQTGKQAFKT